MVWATLATSIPVRAVQKRHGKLTHRFYNIKGTCSFWALGHIAPRLRKL